MNRFVVYGVVPKQLYTVIVGLLNLSRNLVCESVGVVPIDKARLKYEAKEKL